MRIRVLSLIKLTNHSSTPLSNITKLLLKQNLLLLLLLIPQFVHAAISPQQMQISVWIQKQSKYIPPKTKLLAEINNLLPTNTSLLKILERDYTFKISAKSKFRSSANKFLRNLQTSTVYRRARLLTNKSIKNSIFYTLEFSIEPPEKIISYTKSNYSLPKTQTQNVQLLNNLYSYAQNVGEIIDFCPNTKDNKKPTFLPQGIKLAIYPYKLHLIGSYTKILRFIQKIEAHKYYTTLGNTYFFRDSSKKALFHFTANLRIYSQGLRRNASQHAYIIDRLALRTKKMCSKN